MTQNVNSRKIQLWFKPVVALFAAATLIASCSDKDDNDSTLTIDPAQPNENVETDAPKTYTLSIPATFDGSLSKAVSINGTSANGRFDDKETIRICVNNTTMLKGSLRPTDISTDGKSCTLIYSPDNEDNGEELQDLQKGDELTLLYNLTYFSTDAPDMNAFAFDTQNGTSSGIADCGIATGIEVASIEDGKITTDKSAQFTLLQSVFRLQFVDEDNNAINVKALNINSKNTGIVCYYVPFDNMKYQNPSISLNFTDAISDYIYIALCIDETNSANDVLTFTATDDNGNVYQGSKAAPNDGFVNGKYYYSSSAIPLTKQYELTKPTIVCQSNDDYINLHENENSYAIRGNGTYGTTCTISGECYGYRFHFPWGGTVKLNGLTAKLVGESWPYFNSEDDLTIVICDGTDNTIMCDEYAIMCWNGNLKLEGNGTLAITVKNKDYQGIVCNNPNDLASNGYEVTIDETDNDDGTYTYTYTVNPKESIEDGSVD